MERGTYVAASAGLYQMRRLEVVTNNLANSSTAGFKRQLLSGDVQSFEQTLARQLADGDPFARPDHERTPGVVNLETVTDFSQGPIKETGNPLDAALRDPKSFFVVNTPDGPQYTRAGNFTLNVEGELVTQDGFQVQGDGGAITVTGQGAAINPDGSVVAQGRTLGRIQMVRFEDPKVLERAGNTRFRLSPGKPQPEQIEGEVIPQSLEMANVSAIGSMVELIATNRAFQAYTKSAETIDQLNQTAINQIGRPR